MKRDFQHKNVIYVYSCTKLNMGHIQMMQINTETTTELCKFTSAVGKSRVYCTNKLAIYIVYSIDTL